MELLESALASYRRPSEQGTPLPGRSANVSWAGDGPRKSTAGLLAAVAAAEAALRRISNSRKTDENGVGTSCSNNDMGRGDHLGPESEVGAVSVADDKSHDSSGSSNKMGSGDHLGPEIKVGAVAAMGDKSHDSSGSSNDMGRDDLGAGSEAGVVLVAGVLGPSSGGSSNEGVGSLGEGSEAGAVPVAGVTEVSSSSSTSTSCWSYGGDGSGAVGAVVH